MPVSRGRGEEEVSLKHSQTLFYMALAITIINNRHWHALFTTNKAIAISIVIKRQAIE